MLLRRKAKAVGVAVVLVTVQLRKQQVKAGIHQAQVGDVAEALERGAISPQGQYRHHHAQGRNLPNFHAYVEAQNAPQHGHRVVTQRQLLQTGRQAKAMQQAKAKNGHQQVGRLHVKVLLKAAVVVEAFVDDADGDDGVDQIEVPGDLEVGRQDQRDAVPQCERCNKFGDVLEGGQKEDHAKQKQQVVVAREHVAGPQAHVLQVTAVQHALTVFLRNAMRPSQGGKGAQQQGHESPGKNVRHRLEK